jgi:photosystem II stability/assembly factor-like uncharacterized protein
MQTLRLRLNLSLLLTLFLCSAMPAQQGGQLVSLKLLAPDVGWAASSTQLFWTTTDGAQWKDITPSTVRTGKLASVFFLDTITGWVLVTRRNPATGDVSGFDLVATVNGGGNWTTTTVRIPNLDPETLIPGDARITFADGQHGFINVGSGGTAFNAGFLIATTDGGKTWIDTGAADFASGGRGPVLFTSPTDGWFTNSLELYVTHDAAGTWQKISLATPPQVKAISAAYGLPSFSGGSIFLPVTYSSPYFPDADAQSAIVLFSSTDGGKSWAEDRILQNLTEVSTGEVIPSTMAGSNWIVIAKPRSGGNKIESVARNSKVKNLADIGSGVSELSFLDGLRGWAIDGNSRLISTSDGGTTWAEVTPPKRYPPLSKKPTRIRRGY